MDIARLKRTYFSGSSLRARALTSGAALLAGEGYTQLLRLASNLVMTRLLYPEAFGIMLVVNLVLSALGLLSDIGIRSAIVARKGEVSADFLNLAWTIAVLRGVALMLVAVLVAGPISIWYEEPALRPLLLLASLNPLIAGFTSPYPRLSERNVEVGRVVLWQAYVQTVAIIVTVSWLLIHPTIWALAAHGVVLATVQVALSFAMFGGHAVKFHWDSKLARELLTFGKWVLLGTSLTFLGRQGDSFVVSNFLSFEMLGVFSIAVSLAKMVELLAERLCWGLLFPIYAELKNRSSADLRGRIRNIQFGVYGVCFPLVLLLAVFGRDVIRILYDVRYINAGWMLEVISLGLGCYVLASTALCLPLAFEDSKHHMRLQLLRVISVLSTMGVGGYFYGTLGLVWGIAAGQLVFYPLLQISLRRYRLYHYGVDILVGVVVATSVFGVWSLRGWPGPT